MRHCILSLTLAASLALSLSLTSTATAKPIISFTNNHNAIHHGTKSSSHASNDGLLKRLATSWTSLTTSPLQGLRAISGSPGGPASDSVHAGPSKKMFHKRGVDDNSRSIKTPTPAGSGSGSSVNDAQKKKQAADKATARAKHTYSAYEAIVNSDSQMPVFLNQHHPKSATNGKGKGKPTSAAAASVGAAGGAVSEKRKAGAMTTIDILRQTGTKRPTAAAAVTFPSMPSAEEEEEEKERGRKKAKAELEGISPAKKSTQSEKEIEGMTPAKESLHSKKNINTTNKLSTVSHPVVLAAALGEDGASTVKTLFDSVFSQDQQQQPYRRTAESVIVTAGTAVVQKKEDSEDIKAIKKTINDAAHAAVAAAVSGSHHNTPPNSQQPEQHGTAGILKQALKDIAHKIEEAATAAIALENPSLTDQSLGLPSSVMLHAREAPLRGDKPAPLYENHQDTIVDAEGAVVLPVLTNNNNHDNNAEESGTTATKQNPAPIIINDNEYTSTTPEDEDLYTYTQPSLEGPFLSSEYSDDDDEWRLSDDDDDDDDDYMAQYVHRRPDNFPGSESILFTGTVLQRTLASSALLLSGFVVLLGVISYKMYARRRDTSPWAFLHYMTFGIFSSLFYDSAYMSNSTIKSYTTTSPSTVSNSTMKKGLGNAAWLRRGSLIRSSNTTSNTKHNNNNNSIMFSPAEKEPLLPEPVVASSSSSSSSSASSSFKKSGSNNHTELRRTSTAQHHQMQIELALQQRQQQQAELDYLQKSFMRRTSI
jgi:hypothetical protein